MQNQQHITLLSGEIENIKADNVKLYEKIRYLQGYGSGSGKKNVNQECLSK